MLPLLVCPTEGQLCIAFCFCFQHTTKQTIFGLWFAMWFKGLFFEEERMMSRNVTESVENIVTRLFAF